MPSAAAALRATSVPTSRSGSPTCGAPRRGAAARWTRSSARASCPGRSSSGGAPRSASPCCWGPRRPTAPTRDCSAMMLVDDGGDVRDVAEAGCPSCRRLFCARCAVAPWHAGVTCAEYKGLRKGDSGKEDMLLLEMAKGRKWKRCPKCAFFVEKRDGCLHIRCRCGFEFCYGCGR
ncbi:hypothetical protein C2845_PM13G19010 [Panicum miliaceum]|uniref:RBR-type E3 ubiquitin transferase n=1 Tax=Panicum miliaceum TaxID=4540 RepID=A0A3L6RES3_PANMI|nr:hypothetical protein C2845_PM13G19010 [Panicum miliaceum]